MKIRITKFSGPQLWYRECIGEEFVVLEFDRKADMLLVSTGPGSKRFVHWDDCEIVHAPRCPHCGGVLEE